MQECMMTHVDHAMCHSCDTPHHSSNLLTQLGQELEISSSPIQNYYPKDDLSLFPNINKFNSYPKHKHVHKFALPGLTLALHFFQLDMDALDLALLLHNPNLSHPDPLLQLIAACRTEFGDLSCLSVKSRREGDISLSPLSDLTVTHDKSRSSQILIEFVLIFL